MSSLKELIRNSDDGKYEDVDIPEWGNAKYRVRSVPSDVWETYQNRVHKLQMSTKTDMAEVQTNSNRATLVAHALYDPETDEKIFTDPVEGSKILSKKNAGIIAGLFVLIGKLSDQDKTFGDKVKDAEGNSDDGQS
jgi:hypothetical protein